MHFRRPALCLRVRGLACALLACVSLPCGFLEGQALASPPEGVERQRTAPGLRASLGETIASNDSGSLVLSDLSGWVENLAKDAPQPERLSRLTVTLRASGAVFVGFPVHDVAWQGIRYPALERASGIVDSLDEIRVKVLLFGADGKPKLGPGSGARVVLKTGDVVHESFAAFAKSLAQWPPRAPLVLDIRDGVPARHALSVVAILCGAKRPFAIERRGAPKLPNKSLRTALRSLVKDAPQEKTGAKAGPRAGVRIRPDARCSWGSIQLVLDAVLEEGVSRVTFAGNAGELEIDLFPLVQRVRPQTTSSLSEPEAKVEKPIIILEDEVESTGPFPKAEPGSKGAPALEDAYGVGGGASGAFGQRFASKPLLPSGVTAQSEAAVQSALRWLTTHQSPDGSWKADGSDCKTCPSLTGWGAPAGDRRYDVGLTGLALLTYLGNGQTHRFGRYKRTVNRALRWLKTHQKPDGSIGVDPGRGETVYNHAYATQALSEAYAMSRDFTLKKYVSQAIAWILEAQNPGLGWKYGVRTGRNDTSVTGAMVGALLAARTSGIDIPEQAFAGANRWFKRVTDPQGKVGYQTPGGGSSFLPATDGKFDPLPVPAAIAVFARLHARLATREEVAAASRVIGGQLPTWDKRGRKVNFYYWYHGTNAQFQLGGDAWTAWSKALQAALIPHQETEGCGKGSWSPRGEWGLTGGRVYATAMGALCLEGYYRYARSPDR